jgi:hypothetical protein
LPESVPDVRAKRRWIDEIGGKKKRRKTETR